MIPRPRRTIEADLLKAREDEIAADLADDDDGFNDAVNRLNVLLDEWKHTARP